ncbi:MAG: NAD-dependent epimerase/dehydratase family protein, partial [Gammaproteobacteria bacterium]
RTADAEDFDTVHVALPEKVGRACRENDIGRLLHMSALKASSAAPSRYLQTKALGEDATHALSREGVAVTSFRPSVIFGPQDSFFNRFGALLKLSPLVMPLACPNARFAPVFVGDVAEAFVRSLEDETTHGQRYQLCGPGVYTLEALVEFTARQLGLRRRVLPLGDRISWLQAAVLDYVPGKPFSTDNYQSLQVDSICAGGPDLCALGIEPFSIEAIVPTYLGGRNKTGRLRSFRQLARRG